MEQEGSPRAIHDIGLLDFFQGRFRQAALSFEAAAVAEPLNALFLNDLAVARLAFSKLHPENLPAALAAVDEALKVKPALEEAWFNRGEILSLLGLKYQAASAWETYLLLDGSSSWSAVARAREANLALPSIEETWSRQLREIKQLGVSPSAAQAVVNRFPHAARLYVEEEVLSGWADATLQNNPGRAETQLATARAIGHAVFNRTADPMTRDAVNIIDQAREVGNSGLLNQLALAHAAFGRAIKLYKEQDLEEAHSLFVRAASGLGASGSPFVGWAEFYSSLCDHYSDSEGALQAYEHLKETFGSTPYSTLAARIEWMLGTVESNRNQPEVGLNHFHAALSRLDSSIGFQASAFVHVLLAEAYKTLGDQDNAWRARLAALPMLAHLGDRRRLHAALWEASDALLRQKATRPALDVIEEMLANDELWANPGALAEALQIKTEALQALGRSHEALETARRGLNLVRMMPPSAQRERIEVALQLAEGESLSADQPRRAIEILSEALESDLNRGFFFREVRLRIARAQAAAAMGRVALAKSDLLQVIAEQEQIRRKVADRQLRLSYFSGVQAAFDLMVSIQLAGRDSAAEILEIAERARARQFLDSLLLLDGSRIRGNVGMQPQRLAEIIKHLPLRTTLVEFFVLPDQLVVWTIHAGVLSESKQRVDRETLKGEVHTFRLALARHGTIHEIQAAGARVFNRLLRPSLAGLPNESLVLVPDRFLLDVPFAALYDSQRRRFLLEDREIMLAPSASFFLSTAEREPAPEYKDGIDALVFGNPAFDSKRSRDLSRLPAAAAEAAGVAAQYSSSRLLLDAFATREVFTREAGNWKVVHFAGHALDDADTPDRSRLVFAPDRRGDPGFLYASDIVGLPFRKTQLIVLSACQSVSEDKGREGFSGLVASFLSAGVPAVIASLSDVRDRAARDLMLDFHRQLAAGMPAVAALRFAQLSMMRRPASRSPADWASFEIFGRNQARRAQ
ncbi:MAG TPA: CHAT domain-containing protein [Thermoanaerobaculia bacterium]|nr:CHAT domain-containing protein [Thermoanaerobaculia bacterium]